MQIISVIFEHQVITISSGKIYRTQPTKVFPEYAQQVMVQSKIWRKSFQ